MCTYSPPRFALQLCDVFAEWRTANRGNKTSPHTQQKWRTHLLFFLVFFFLSVTTSLWQIRQGRNAYAFSLSVNCLFFFLSMCLSGVVYLLFFPLASFFFLALFFFFFKIRCPHSWHLCAFVALFFFLWYIELFASYLNPVLFFLWLTAAGKRRLSFLFFVAFFFLYPVTAV